MSQDELKQKVARAAISEIVEEGIIGIGSGSTVNYFIKELAKIAHKIEGTVASSKATEDRLKQYGIPVYDLNVVNSVALTVDGADEATRHLALIKGGGGALTREKILVAASNKFICIIDESKLVNRLGAFPLAIEVIPMARSYVARAIMQFGGSPVYRENMITDNGNIILDIHNLTINEPEKLEQNINQITGVVANGLFARHTPEKLLVARETGVDIIV